jgi:hypothetical protein
MVLLGQVELVFEEFGGGYCVVEPRGELQAMRVGHRDSSSRADSFLQDGQQFQVPYVGNAFQQVRVEKLLFQESVVYLALHGLWGGLSIADAGEEHVEAG